MDNNPFSVESAQKLIRKYDKLLQSLFEADKLLVTTTDLVSSKVNDLQLRGSFSNFALRDFLSQGRFKTDSSCFSDLIWQLVIYQKIMPIVHETKQMLHGHQNVCSDLNVLRSVPSAVKWHLLSSNKKDAIVLSYNRLHNFLENGFEKQVKNIIHSVNAISQTSLSEAVSSYNINKGIYYEALMQLKPDLAMGTCCIPHINSLLNKYTAYKKQYDTATANICVMENKIRNGINSIAGKETMLTLKDVSVEELAREQHGIKIKLLQDSGYATIADICAATQSNIASINGIGWNAAATIKRAAAEFYSRTVGNAKIRLSTDNKTDEALELITGIFEYRKKKPVIDLSKKLYSEYISDIELALENLSLVGNGVKWLFLDEDEKKTIVDSYEYLRGIAENDFITILNEVIWGLTEKSHATENIIWEDFEQNSIEYFNIIEDLVPGALGNGNFVYGLPEDLALQIQDEAYFPDGLTCSLRNYQEWGVKYILHQEKVLLGDEMGLGKTVQAIATMVSLKNTGETHFMVVCPASVLPNWCKEISKKSKLRVTRIHGKTGLFALKDWIRCGGVAVTTFESTFSIELGSDVALGLLVVDEAHYIKNQTTRRTNSVKKLAIQAKRLLFMTGTALENKVEEMVALVGMLQPDIATNLNKYAYISASKQFREMAAPVYYRRKREDVLRELPELIDTKEWCIMTPQEESAYEIAVLSSKYQQARRVSWNVDNWEYSGKARRMFEIIEDAKNEGRKILVFSYFLDTLKGIAKLLGDQCVGVINGSVAPNIRQKIIDVFNDAPAGSVLVAQIQSGGTGLNIQSASTIILCEPQLKPSIENQAISRAYRMGQTRNVLVYRLLCENSIDEKIVALLENKQERFNAFADKSVAAEAVKEKLEAIDDTTFGQIIEEEIERINTKKATTESAGEDNGGL